ncbi:hypothetical protein ELE36_06175 [Pseudolysobacter antarcticus]|uniref:Sel1 repeat family protein n=1 Tax=Pseudolysobacter antarcticus TaxID=2511995 RepID=A0A411HHV5_9GAMM|nr:hypothetical protein [Pseudolysobacter antarcticus]QBB69980.1 hypothetical protein ELE36_06175 [Pseudolysobacter antarcticus]
MKKFARYILTGLLGFAALNASAESPSAPAFESVDHADFFSMLKRADQALQDKESTTVFAQQQRLACAGSQSNQAALGGLYLTGRGVTEDDITGYSWLKLASASGMPAQRDLVKKLEQGMTPAQHVVADAKVEKLQSLYGPMATHMSCSQVNAPGSHLKQLVCNPERIDADGRLVWLKRCVDGK